MDVGSIQKVGGSEQSWEPSQATLDGSISCKGTLKIPFAKGGGHMPPVPPVPASMAFSRWPPYSIGDFFLFDNQGKCIGQGTFAELVDMGIDFVSLLSSEDDPDSAIESDTETTLEVRTRRFSQQISCHPDEIKPRSNTFLRQESLFSEENRMQSELSIPGDAQQVEVYVSLQLHLRIQRLR